MSIDSEAGQDLALEPDDAEEVVGGREVVVGRRKSKNSVTGTSKQAARTLPLMVTVEATTPPVPGPPDPGADASGPEADNC